MSLSCPKTNIESGTWIEMRVLNSPREKTGSLGNDLNNYFMHYIECGHRKFPKDIHDKLWDKIRNSKDITELKSALSILTYNRNIFIIISLDFIGRLIIKKIFLLEKGDDSVVLPFLGFKDVHRISFALTEQNIRDRSAFLTALRVDREIAKSIIKSCVQKRK